MSCKNIYIIFTPLGMGVTEFTCQLLLL